MRLHLIILLVLIYGCSNEESMVNSDLRLTRITETTVFTENECEFITPLIYRDDQLTKIGLDSLIYNGDQLSKIIRIDSFDTVNSYCVTLGRFFGRFDSIPNRLFYSMSIMRSGSSTTLMVDSIRYSNSVGTFVGDEIPFLKFYKNENGLIDSIIRTQIFTIPKFQGPDKEEFFYDEEGNLKNTVHTNTTTFFGRGSETIVSETTYEYDMSSNPFSYMDEEIVIFFQFGPLSKNNPIRVEEELITNIVYEYNSHNYPISSEIFSDTFPVYLKESFEYENIQ